MSRLQDHDLITLYQAKQLVPGISSPIEGGGALVAEDGVILAIGTSAELQFEYPQAERVDFDDAVIVPLLVNAHTSGINRFSTLGSCFRA